MLIAADENRQTLFSLACRKHIGEVILSHVWDALNIETSRSPNIKTFKRFQDKRFDATPHDIATWHTSNAQLSREFVTAQSTKVKKFMNHEREVQSYTRGGYKELSNLIEACTNNRNRTYKFAKCKAVNRAQDGWRSNCTAINR